MDALKNTHEPTWFGDHSLNVFLPEVSDQLVPRFPFIEAFKLSVADQVGHCDFLQIEIWIFIDNFDSDAWNDPFKSFFLLGLITLILFLFKLFEFRLGDYFCILFADLNLWVTLYQLQK